MARANVLATLMSGRPVMLEWKTFWAVIAAAIAAAAATLTATGIITAWITIAGTIATAIASALIAHVIVDTGEHFGGMARWKRRRVITGMIAAITLYAAWTITASAVTITWENALVLAFALALIAVGTYAGARSLEWRLSRIAAPRSETTPPGEPLTARENVLASVIRKSGIPNVTVMPGAESLRSNAGWNFRVQVNPPSSLPKDQRTGAITELDHAAAEPIAIALANRTGRTVHSDWVRIKKEKGAGIYAITVLNRDLLAEVVPYRDDPTPTSITTPALIGIEADGTEYRERQDVHQRDIGMSTAGKTSLMHVKLAHLTRCTDAIIWVCGTQKLYDFVGGWVEPYEGSPLRPPIDWIANGQEDCLQMMHAAMSVARWRQAQRNTSRGWRTIILITDEASFVTDDSATKITFDSKEFNASQMIAMLVKGAASGQVHQHIALQSATVDQMGEEGGTINKQLEYNHAFATRDFLEVGRMTGDFKLPLPVNKGEFYAFGNAPGIMHLKAPYIQTTDPTKPRLHDGPTVADISWSRRHITKGGLTQSEGLAAAGTAYANRHTHVTEEFMAYLTGSPVTSTNTQTNTITNTNTTENEAYAETIAQLEAELAAEGIDIRPQPTEPPAAPVITGTIVKPSKPRDERIIDILTSENEPMGTADIATALADDGDDVSRDTLHATLSRMARSERITRTAPGMYAANKQANKQVGGGSTR